jgi:acyl-CoA synthetase (AMP-forming)/AMP-acid ligase II
MVEKGPVNEADALARKHPIAAFSLDALAGGAAKLRPERVALAEAGPGVPSRSISYGEFDQQVRACAQHLLELGLAPDERILILSGARTACVVLAIAALAAGLEPLLVPIGLASAQLADIAASARCAVIAGPTSYGELNLEQTLFETAAHSETIRFVATLGPTRADGAIDFAPEGLRTTDATRSPAAAEIRPRIGTLTEQREPVFHEQSALLAAALDLVGKAEIAAGAHLLSTLAPASFASLVTGPVATLLSGASLTLLGPFEAASFLTLLDRHGPSHCIVPAAILPNLAEAGLLRDRVLASAIVVVREETRITFSGDCPLIEVRARGDASLSMEYRAREDSKAAPIWSGDVLAPVPPVRQAERGWR